MKLLLFCSRRALFIVLLCSVALSAHAQQPSDERNLFKNWNFEQGLEGWSQKKNTEAAIDPTEKHGSNPVLKIENPKPNDASVTQKVAVTPNTRYRLSAFIRTKNVKPVKRGAKNGACISIVGGPQHTPFVTGTSSLTKVELEWSTGAETEIEVGPRLGMSHGAVTGTAWFSEVKMVAIDAER